MNSHYLKHLIESPSDESLYILGKLLSSSKSELRALIKHGLEDDEETEATRKQIRDTETAITNMKAVLKNQSQEIEHV